MSSFHRLKATGPIREMVSQVEVKLSHLIQPYFVHLAPTAPISGFGQQMRWHPEDLLTQVEKDRERGLKSFLLFGKVDTKEKDPEGKKALDPEGPLPQALSLLRKHFGDSILLFSDVCLCPYTSHGHCGVLGEKGIDSEKSVEILTKMAMLHKESGVHFVAPSDMMDGTVASIRKSSSKIGILAYTVKMASSYFGPFREALDSAPTGDRKSYQMDYRRENESWVRLQSDIEAGADLCMVKPALPNLDILCRLSDAGVPLAAYCVSGEYQMVKLLSEKGLVQEREMVVENLTSIRRAGASVVVTYHASEIAKERWL